MPSDVATFDSLPTELVDGLSSAIRGPVYTRSDARFSEYVQIFNGNVRTPSKAIVYPLDAEDVSRIVTFCNLHTLSFSVKAGGYGTAGWSINGDVIIDLQKIGDVDIEPPSQNPGLPYTSLRDMAPPNSKGKAAVRSHSTTTKRPREDDVIASELVETFLQSDRHVRRRMRSPEQDEEAAMSEAPHAPPIPTPGIAPNEHGQGHGNGSGNVTVVETLRFPPSSGVSVPQNGAAVPSSQPFDQRRADADPFGYLNTSPTPLPAGAVQSNYPHSLSATSRSGNSSSSGSSSSSTVSPPIAARGGVRTPSASTLVANPRLPPAHLSTSAHVTPIHEVAYMTFGAGMKMKAIDTYSATHPLEGTGITGENEGIPYHVPFAAHPVGSTIMILGGFGFLSRLHGLSIDNLVEIEMVLADGRIVIIDKDKGPDLWWAVRGAGPAFGIATRYKAKAYPVPVVFAGNLIYRFHKATAPSLIKHFRDCVKGAPRELYANVLLTAGPQGKDSLVVVQMCYLGPKEKGQEFLSAISSWDGESCLLNEIDEKSFLHQQDSVAQVLRAKAGRQWFIRSALITSLPDDVVNTTVMQFADSPVGCTWLFELAGGAIADFEDTCMPKVQREASFTIAALHQWDMGVDDPRCIESAEEWIFGTLGPVQTGGPIPSFIGRHESSERVMACFGENWARLKELKKKYDPNNVFKNTFWPLGQDEEVVEPHSHEPPTP